jgi:putative flippase GtrA
MQNFQFGPSSSTGSAAGPSQQEPRRHSVLSLILLIAAVAVVTTVGLGFAFWALGFLFHMLGWILRVAILTAVVAFVWKRVTRRGCRSRS